MERLPPAPLRLTLALAILGVLAAACTGAGASPSGTFAPTPAPAASLALTDGVGALSWGDGDYGLVLLGDGSGAADWRPQAERFAADRMSVVAVDALSAGALRAAIEELHGQRVERVAVLAAGVEAGAAAFSVGAAEPELLDQLIVVSGAGDASRLGEFPKLFAASEGEPAAADARRMAEEAPGDWNVLLLVPGDASGRAIFDDADGGAELMRAVLLRLQERR